MGVITTKRGTYPPARTWRGKCKTCGEKVLCDATEDMIPSKGEAIVSWSMKCKTCEGTIDMREGRTLFFKAMLMLALVLFAWYFFW